MTFEQHATFWTQIAFSVWNGPIPNLPLKPEDSVTEWHERMEVISRMQSASTFKECIEIAMTRAIYECVF